MFDEKSLPRPRSTRRRFLKFSAGAISLSVLAACSSQPSAPPTVAPVAATAPTTAAPAAQPANTPTAKPAATQASAMVATGAPKRGGTLNVVVQNDWVTLDPVYNSAEPNGTNMLYGEWIRWEKDPKTGQWGPQPEMIAEWDLTADQVTLKLQQGIKFHDGTPWDASAAKWNLDRMIFDPASNIKAYFAAVDVSKEDKAALDSLKTTAAQTFDYSSKAVEVVDPSTVRLHLHSPAAGILPTLSNAMQWNNPISPAAFKKAGKQAFGRNPVGAGPFKFVEWKSGTGVTLERNPDYWKKGADGQSLPYLDKIVYRLIVDDSVRLVEVRSGNSQFADLIQGKDVASVKSDPSLSFLESESSGNNYRLIFDSTNQSSPIKSKKLRQAVLYALDRDAMAKTLGFGSGYGRKYLQPKGSVAYDESMPYYWYDQAKAQQLFKEAVAETPGLAGSDGKVAVTLSVINRDVDKAQSEMIKQMLEGIGFNTKIEILERAAWTAKLVKIPGQPGGSFDIATMRNPVVPDDPDDQWRTFFYSSGGFNVAHRDVPALDKLIDDGAATYDVEKRKGIYRQLDQAYYDDPWYGWLWQQNWNWLFSKKLKNFKEPVTNRWMFSEVWLE